MSEKLGRSMASFEKFYTNGVTRGMVIGAGSAFLAMSVEVSPPSLDWAGIVTGVGFIVVGGVMAVRGMWTALTKDEEAKNEVIQYRMRPDDALAALREARNFVEAFVKDGDTGYSTQVLEQIDAVLGGKHG